MKFVCENCKAKYQIGDDKVSGKTVRMKCRRCGHLILVSATVTESSVAKHAPAEGAPFGAQPTPPGALHAAAPGDAVDDDEGASTVIMTAPAALRMAPGKPADPTGPRAAPQPPRASGTQAMPATPAQPPKAPVAPNAPGRPAPPKPSVPARPGGPSPFVPAAAPSAPSVADLAQRSMSSAISAAARGTANPLGPGRSGAVTRGHLALAPTPGPTPNAANHLASVPFIAENAAAPGGQASGGVAGAFQRVAAAPAPALRVDTPGEDWYVGVGGVPIGPVRLSVIREKVEQGAVDGESLVWREGFEEWQPLRNVPGLRAILDEPRRSTSPTPPPDGSSGKISSSSLPRVSSPFANGHASGAAFGAAPAPAPSHASVAPTASSPPAAETTGQAALSSLVSTGGVALGPAASADALPSPDPAAPLPPPAVTPGPSVSSLASKPVSIAPPPAASVPPPAREDHKKGMHPFAYAMIAMAAVFGGVAAWVLLIKPPPEPTVIVKTVTADPGLHAAPPPPPTDKPDEAPAPSASVDAKTPTGPIAQGGPKASSAPSTKPGDPPPANLESFGSGPGPVTNPTTPDNGGGNGKLSEGEISSVVSRNTPRVRRQCWQPALDASSGSGPKSARVSTQITIAPSGSVASVSASGADNFPGLASCVAGAIRGWTFPKSDGTTPVNVPFSFNAQ